MENIPSEVYPSAMRIGSKKLHTTGFNKSTDPQVFLEDSQRLSQSILWELQRAAYCQFGPQAWSQKGVPFYVTSNPFTARQYAQVFLGYIRDILPQIDRDHPIYILDLGAGTGRFGFLFLKSLLELLDLPVFRGVNVCYVMTDIAKKNIEFWQTHPKLAPFIESNLLDFAEYHQEEKQKPLHLLRRNIFLSRETLVNPLILIANYFFDTIPQDLFRVHQGNLEEGRISIAVTPTKEVGEMQPNNPNIIPQMSCSYSYVPVENPEKFYSGRDENNILHSYANQFDNSTFLFPIGAFQSLQYFSELSGGRLCLLAGDQGVCTSDQVTKWGEPKISRHGSFSIAVSYHAIAHFFRNKKGVALLTSFPDPQFVVMTGILGGECLQFRETAAAFSTHFDWFEPCDYWRIVNAVEKNSPHPSLELMMLLLKLGNWDPMLCHEVFTQIRGQLATASEETKRLLKNMLQKVWENFYPVAKEDGNFAVNLGVLCYDITAYNEARFYFQQAMTLMGEQPQIMQNIRACEEKISTFVK